RKQLRRDTPRLAARLSQVSLNLLRCAQHAEAETLLRECLAIREKIEPDAWTTFNARSLLGWSLLGQQKDAQAEPQRVRAYEGMKQRVAQIPPAFNADFHGAKLPHTEAH